MSENSEEHHSSRGQPLEEPEGGRESRRVVTRHPEEAGDNRVESPLGD